MADLLQRALPYFTVLIGVTVAVALAVCALVTAGLGIRNKRRRREVRHPDESAITRG